MNLPLPEFFRLQLAVNVGAEIAATRYVNGGGWPIDSTVEQARKDKTLPNVVDQMAIRAWNLWNAFGAEHTLINDFTVVAAEFLVQHGLSEAAAELDAWLTKEETRLSAEAAREDAEHQLALGAGPDPMDAVT